MSSDANDFSTFLYGGDHPRSRAERLPNGEGGDDIALLTDSDHQSIDNCEGKGENNGEGSALTQNRLNFYFSAEVFDITANHVHADSAP